MKRILAVCFVVLLFTLRVCAEEEREKDIYTEQYHISGADELEYSLPDETREILDDIGIDPSSPDWTKNLTEKNALKHIKDIIFAGFKTPFKTGAVILTVILITAAISAACGCEKDIATVTFASTLAVAVGAAAPVWNSVSAAAGVVKGCATFMLSFIPVFAAIVTVSGAAVTSAAMSTLLIGASQVVVSVSSHHVLPLMGGYLGMSICESVSPLIGRAAIGERVKKLAFWTLSFVSMLFIGILGIQTAVNASADSLTLKTAKFIIGTVVPVAGGTVSEAVSTVTASFSLLRSSVGIYAVVALAILLLPVIAELVCWRIVMTVCSVFSDMFLLHRTSGVLKAIDAMLSVLLGMIFLVAAVFIISLSVVIGAVKG